MRDDECQGISQGNPSTQTSTTLQPHPKKRGEGWDERRGGRRADRACLPWQLPQIVQGVAATSSGRDHSGKPKEQNIMEQARICWNLTNGFMSAGLWRERFIKLGKKKYGILSTIGWVQNPTVAPTLFGKNSRPTRPPPACPPKGPCPGGRESEGSLKAHVCSSLEDSRSFPTSRLFVT